MVSILIGFKTVLLEVVVASVINKAGVVVLITMGVWMVTFAWIDFVGTSDCTSQTVDCGGMLGCTVQAVKDGDNMLLSNGPTTSFGVKDVSNLTVRL